MISFRPYLTTGTVITTAVPLMLASLVALAVNPDTTILQNGAELSVQIDDPLQDEEFKVPAALGPGGTIDVPVAGTASVGEGVPQGLFVYIMDVSGSTTEGSGTGCAPILDCETIFFSALNSTAAASGSIAEVAVVVYAGTEEPADPQAGIGDLSPDPGQQDFSPPGSANVDTVINSAFSNVAPGDGGLADFTLVEVGFRTNCEAGLAEALSLVMASASPSKNVLFASDGECNEGLVVGPTVTALAGAGAILNSVAIGTNSFCNTDPNGLGSLNDITANGGICREVEDPGNLPDIIPDLIGTNLDAVQVSVNGGDIPTNTNPMVPVVGPRTVDYDATFNDGVGDYLIEATAMGSDATGGMDDVTADVTVHLLQLSAGPANETNELSVDDSHTVTAEILGGSGPTRDVDFVVGGQNAASANPANGSVPADPNVPVQFSYSVPQACSSLGSDTITVSTVIGGMADSVTLNKDWVDTTIPVASCTPSVNPHGQTEPRAPGQGQNEDGFYLLSAEDNLADDCDPLVISAVDESGFVFGPFAVGDVIKYTQDDDAAQEEKKIGSNNGQAGAVTAHLIGHGDLTVTATDQSGNTSDPVMCLVPQPPK